MGTWCLLSQDGALGFYLGHSGYINRTPLSIEQQAIEDKKLQDFIDRMGGIVAVWENFCQPKIEERCTWIRESGPEVSTVELVDTLGYAFHMTMVSLKTMALVLKHLTDFLTEELGVDAEFLSVELTAGGANETLMANQVLWDLAQLVRASDSLKDAVIATEPDHLRDAISKIDQGHEFLAAFDDYLQRYGGRATRWECSYQTVREQPEVSLESIKHAVMNDVSAPLEVQRNVLSKADQLATETENRVDAKDGKRETFRALLDEVKPYVTLRENRAFWQLVAYGSLRVAMLRKGWSLVDAGVIDEVEDVFYLEPAEIDQFVSDNGDSAKAFVEQRRQEWEFWNTKTPPKFIGHVVEPTESESESDDASDKVLRGLGVSRGVVTGRARVIMDLSDAPNFQPGEILVCVMTSPPWTILFTKAAAVVTETGAVLSHASIASREFGLPCVAAVQNVTTLIKDGMLITVDGTEGTVTIEE
jgi:phosphohistidine swiveling domain-containing protein